MRPRVNPASPLPLSAQQKAVLAYWLGRGAPELTVALVTELTPVQLDFCWVAWDRLWGRYRGGTPSPGISQLLGCYPDGCAWIAACLEHPEWVRGCPWALGVVVRCILAAEVRVSLRAATQLHRLLPVVLGEKAIQNRVNAFVSGLMGHLRGAQHETGGVFEGIPFEEFLWNADCVELLDPDEEVEEGDDPALIPVLDNWPWDDTLDLLVRSIRGEPKQEEALVERIVRCFRETEEVLPIPFDRDVFFSVVEPHCVTELLRLCPKETA